MKPTTKTLLETAASAAWEAWQAWDNHPCASEPAKSWQKVHVDIGRHHTAKLHACLRDAARQISNRITDGLTWHIRRDIQIIWDEVWQAAMQFGLCDMPTKPSNEPMRQKTMAALTAACKATDALCLDEGKYIKDNDPEAWKAVLQACDNEKQQNRNDNKP